MIPRAPRTIHACLGLGAEGDAQVSALIRAAGREVVLVSEDDLPQRLGEMEVLLCHVAPGIDWSAARRLRLLHTMNAGVESLWPATGLPAQTIIANARGVHLPEIRDHALALMLAFARALPRLLDQQRRRHWEGFAAGTLSGKTAGILGLGEIGRGIAGGCAALGMRVIGTRTSPGPVPHVHEVLAPEDTPRVLREADYLVVTLPLTSRTRGSLGAPALALLRPTAVVIQLSRGGILDQAALESALRGGRLAGAALDVFAEEPLPASSTLWTAPNLIVTPHVAGWTENYFDRAVALFLDNVDRVERGEPPRTPVDRAREY